MTSIPLLEACALSLRFGHSLAVDAVSLKLLEGEVVAIVGASGSGKSSLLLCLSGILRPSEGTVSFRGARMDTADDETLSEWRREHFGFVFQFGELVPELTLEENVALPLLFGGTARRTAQKAAAAVLRELGVGELGSRRPAQVSGGQMQRAAVARALVSRPEVVFADEPTGALDSRNAELVLEALIVGAGERGAAIVLVTHDEGVAARADHQIEMHDGRIVTHRGS